MVRAILLASLLTTGLLAQPPMPPRIRDYQDATVIKIDSTATYYEYTVETAKDGYLIRRLAITEGSHVKIAIGGEYVYITDEDGRPQQTTGVLQYRLPAPPPPQKTAAWFDPNRERTIPLNLHG